MTEDNERRVSVRIDDERLSEWMDAQTNVSQSIRVLMMLARRFDSGDFTLAFAERGGFLTDEVDVSRPRIVKKGRQHASARVTGKQSVKEEKPEKRQYEPSDDTSEEIRREVKQEIEEPQVPEVEVVDVPDEQEEQQEQDRTADMMARLRKNSPTKRPEETPEQSSDGDFSQMMVNQYNNN